MSLFAIVRTVRGDVLHYFAVGVNPAPFASVTEPGVDLKLAALPGGGVDLAVVGGDLAMDAGLGTAALASLWTDRRADLDDGLGLDDDPRGYWADREGARWGSRLWLLDRKKRIDSTLRQAEDSAREALEWLRPAQIASRVRASASWGADGELRLVVTIERADSARWDSLWRGTEQELALEGEGQTLRLLFD